MEVSIVIAGVVFGLVGIFIGHIIAHNALEKDYEMERIYARLAKLEENK